MMRLQAQNLGFINMRQKIVPYLINNQNLKCSEMALFKRYVRDVHPNTLRCLNGIIGVQLPNELKTDLISKRRTSLKLRQKKEHP